MITTTTRLAGGGNGTTTGTGLMLPSDTQHGKRKAAEDEGAPAKRSKKDTSQTKTTNKRKLEEVPGGLMIVRAPSSRPPSAQPPSRPPSTQPPDHPPAKKPRTDSRTGGKGKARDTPELEADVRQMDEESNSLRRAAAANSSNSSGASRSTVHFPPPTPLPKGKGKQKHVDEVTPLPEHDTPQMARNKALRDENTNAHRRRSSVGSRGKRISNAFEESGVIAQPHKSVSDLSLYKHIDTDLPETHRARQLLIWCTSRAPLNDPSGKDPPLSISERDLLQGVKDDMMRMLAEGKVDVHAHAPNGKGKAKQTVAENTQNVQNRAREVLFSSHIASAQAEDNAWSDVVQAYNARRTQVVADIERRTASAKARGKQREDTLAPREPELPREFRGPRCVDLARRIMSEPPEMREHAESSIAQRVRELRYKVDTIGSSIRSAQRVADAAQTDLDDRFARVSARLAAHAHPLARPQPPVPHPIGYAPERDQTDLFRALAAVDAERPPHAIGDAARKAQRDVERIEAGGGVGEGNGERRLTGVPSGSGTPRRTPGTPNRGTTPGRGSMP